MSRFNSVERNTIVEKSQECLWSDEGNVGLKYLIETRKLSENVIKKFKLGFLPANLNHKLAGRIIFPIEDSSDNLIAISSRLICEPKNELPVYWHEPYEKSFYLYGIKYAIKSMRELNYVVVVEGQFDVIQLSNHKIENVVALCSGTMSYIQSAILQRYCEKIVLLLDRDKNNSGQKNTQRIIESFSRMPISKKMTFMTLPEYVDPDEFVIKHGRITLVPMIEVALDRLNK